MVEYTRMESLVKPMLCGFEKFAHTPLATIYSSDDTEPGYESIKTLLKINRTGIGSLGGLVDESFNLPLYLESFSFLLFVIRFGKKAIYRIRPTGMKNNFFAWHIVNIGNRFEDRL